MRADLLNGTLFVLLTAAVAWHQNDPWVIVLLALGCACGWFSEAGNAFSPFARLLALFFWAVAFIFLTARMI